MQFLGITAEELCGIKNYRVVHFMFHDRVAFGGALISVGALYMWMAEFPLRQGEAWAQNRGSSFNVASTFSLNHQVSLITRTSPFVGC